MVSKPNLRADRSIALHSDETQVPLGTAAGFRMFVLTLRKMEMFPRRRTSIAKIPHWEKQRPEFSNGERPGVVRYREEIRWSALRARGLNGEGERGAVADGIAQPGRNDAADRKRRGECVRFQRAAQFLPEERFAAVRVEKVHG